MGFIGGILGDIVSTVEHVAGDLIHGDVAGAFGDVAGGIGKLVSDADPLSKLVDLASDTLGLPDALKDVLKIGAGIATGDVACAADGALEGFDTATHALPAHTDYQCSSKAVASRGYYQARVSVNHDPEARTHSSGGSVHTTSTPKNPAPVGSSQGGATGSAEALQAFEMLEKNFPEALALSGRFPFGGKGELDRSVLQAISDNPQASGEIKRAARYLLDHPDAYNEVAKTKGKIAKGDLEIAIEDEQKKLAQGGATQGTTGSAGPSTTQGTPPVKTGRPPPSQSTTSASQSPAPTRSSGASGSTDSGGLSAAQQGQLSALSSQIGDILANPNMSIEEKIMEILMLLQEKNDIELEGAMNNLAQVQDKRNSIDRTADDSEGKLDQNHQEMDRVQFQMQQLMDKRKQLSELMSNIEASFNEMAKVAIQNLAR